MTTDSFLPPLNSAKKASSTKPKLSSLSATPRKDPYAIVPSAIHQRCKEHSTIGSSSQPQPPTLLHRQHAAQASKMLSAHTPSKPAKISSATNASATSASSSSSSSSSIVSAPRTAPRPVTFSAASKKVSEIPSMPALMTPQAKAKRTSMVPVPSSTSKATVKATSSTSTVSRLNFSKPKATAPTTASSAPVNASSSAPANKKDELDTFEAPKHASEDSMKDTNSETNEIVDLSPSEPPTESCSTETVTSHTITLTSTIKTLRTTRMRKIFKTRAPALPIAPSAKSPVFSEKQRETLYQSSLWNGWVDAFAIKILERQILSSCITVVRDYCPRNGDDANEVMEKYVSGRKKFDEIDRMHRKIISLISNQPRLGMPAPQKVWKTAPYYLYRSMFEESHEQITEATNWIEKAIETGSEPKQTVERSFKAFCSRIRELTEKQMELRESLAVGVRRVQEKISEDGQREKRETEKDAMALVNLLEEPEPEFDDFEALEECEAMESGDFCEREGSSLQEESQMEISLKVDENKTESIEMRGEFNEMEGEFEAEFKEEISENSFSSISAVAPRQTPSKLSALSRTPLGKPQRRIVFGEASSKEEEEEEMKINAFKLIYETAKPSKKTKQVVDSAALVTPVRRSNRIDKPLREGESISAMDLMRETEWSWQPNESLLASGRLVTMSASKSTVRRTSVATVTTLNSSAPIHLVSLESASKILEEINAKAPQTPSRLGPARRVPIMFHEELDEDEDKPTVVDKEQQEDKEIEELSKLTSGLQSIGFEATQENINTTPIKEQPKVVEEEIDVEEEETIEEEEEISKVSAPLSTPARRSTRKASVSATKVITSKVRTPAAKKTSRRQSTIEKNSQFEESTKSSSSAKVSASLAHEEPEQSSLYLSMRKAAFTASLGSGYVISTPKRVSTCGESGGAEDASKDNADQNNDEMDVCETPSRRSRRIANKKL